VKKLYHCLRANGVDPWLDAVNLLPGQDWRWEIPRVVRSTDVVIVCLSRRSVNRIGYVQNEIEYALDVADQQRQGTIFLIPVRLENCRVPERLSRWHWVNLFEEGGYERLIDALQRRANPIGVTPPQSEPVCTTLRPSEDDRVRQFLLIVMGLAFGGGASILANLVIGIWGLTIGLLLVLALLPMMVAINFRFKFMGIFAISLISSYLVIGAVLFTGEPEFIRKLIPPVTPTRDFLISQIYPIKTELLRAE
jgi:hypothetical protein